MTEGGTARLLRHLCPNPTTESVPTVRHLTVQYDTTRHWAVENTESELNDLWASNRSPSFAGL